MEWMLNEEQREIQALTRKIVDDAMAHAGLVTAKAAE